jgi:hypothetical protein
MRASDGIQYGAWKFINATDTAPVLTPNNVNITVSHSNPVAASTLFTASDQDGDGIAQYDFWGTGTAGGHWLLNGNALPNGQDNFIDTSQLSQVTYQGGAGTETIWMRASDGIQYGAWKFINATDTAPVLTPNNVNITVSHSNPVAASTLFAASDQDGDGITTYDFWGTGTAGGHWLLNGNAARIISSMRRSSRRSHIRAAPVPRRSGCAPATASSTAPGYLSTRPTPPRW